MSLDEALSYDDVLLLPSYADFLPGETYIGTKLTDSIRLNVPVISAAMDTVTESGLAIALALQGGAGVIHRNLSPDAQAEEVRSVKRHLNWIIENPLTVSPHRTVAEVRQIMDEQEISGLPVIDGKTLVGIVTSRDLRFSRDDEERVQGVMTPTPVVEVGIPTLESAQEKFDTYKIEKLPVVNDEGALTGLITVKDMEKQRLFPKAATDDAGRLIVGAAVAPTDIEARMERLAAAKVDFVVTDTAHGDSLNVVRTVEFVKKRYPELPIIGGNVATREGAARLMDAGVDILKVGVGPGSICTTRVVAGIGVPQFSAVAWASEEAAKRGVPTIADGGIKYSGDITKAIAAGASAVMIGNLFAGLKEAPGREILFEGRIFKIYRGMGSVGAMRKGSGDRYAVAAGEEPVPEGIEGRVPYKGELKPFLYQLVTGLRKGMGYCGCRSLAELQRYGKFVKITGAGWKESHVHDVQMTQEPANYSRS